MVAPLVIDLGPTGSEQADGLQFFDRFSSPIFFDYDNDLTDPNDPTSGYKERTAWVGPNEGIVVWDKDGDIKVWTEADRDTEGYPGDAAIGRMKEGSVAPSEFVMTEGDYSAGKTDLHVILKHFDTDTDGKLSTSELEAAQKGGKLYIWQDRNLDGIAQNDEVVLLTKLVSEIDATGVDFLDPTSEDYLDRSKLADTDNDGDLEAIPEVRFRDGSMIYGTAKVTLTQAGGGGTTTAYDMGFAHNEIGIREADDGTIDFENGNKAYNGTTGNDVFDVTGPANAGHKAKDWSLTGRDGDDRLTGGEGDDMISGGAGIDKLFGGRGDDLIVMDAADDAVNGGLGYDIVMVEGTAGVALNLTAAEVEAFYGGKGNDVASAAGSLGVYLNGGEGNDSLTGSAEGDFLIGGEGNDTILGGDEGDYLHGGAGIDALYGGAGDDVVVADDEDALFSGKVTGGGGYDILIVTGDNTAARTFILADLAFESAVGGARRRRLAGRSRRRYTAPRPHGAAVRREAARPRRALGMTPGGSANRAHEVLVTKTLPAPACVVSRP